MKETTSSLHIWSDPPSFLRSSGCFRLLLWRLILRFGIVFPYTHVPSFLILHCMKFVSTSAGFKRFAQMCSRLVHLLFKRRVSGMDCAEKQRRMRKISVKIMKHIPTDTLTFSAISGIRFHRPDSINSWCWFFQPSATLTGGRNDGLPAVLGVL